MRDSGNLSLSGITVGLTDSNIPSVKAYGDVPYSAPALNLNKDELLHNTPGYKHDNMINKIPIHNLQEETNNSITSRAKNDQDVLGFESSNAERRSRTKEQVSTKKDNSIT